MAESGSLEIREEENALPINSKENFGSELEASSTANGNYESQNAEVDSETAHLQDRGTLLCQNQTEVHGEAYLPVDIALAINITQMIERLEPPLSPKCCIYRVPSDLRKLNEEAYTPQVISIGPFHHGDERLKTMEMRKGTYFKIFVRESRQTMENLVSTIRSKETSVRRHYSQTSSLSSDDYVKMILLDASFIIIFFLADKVVKLRLFDNLTTFSPQLRATVLSDIWLLENQLPFFIIEEIYNLAFPSHSSYQSFTQLTCLICEASARGFFSLPPEQHMISPDSPPLDHFAIMHFTGLLRTFSLPQPERLRERKPGKQILHLYSATQLDEAGVKFRVGSNRCLFDLKFTNGVLEIPCLTLYDNTESLFRNLVALEQCHYQSDHYVTDYIRILDFLIDIDKDVDLLVRKGILIHTLGDSNAVTTLVNKLGQRIRLLEMNSNYSCLCEKLNTFYKVPCHSWKATLRRDYFSTPWRIASTTAAIILLVLTFIQTICSIISLRHI